MLLKCDSRDVNPAFLLMKVLAIDGTSQQPCLATSQMTEAELRKLYLAHGAELRQVLARLAPELDADDLLQEVFLLAIRKREQLAQTISPRAWLYGVAIKLAATRRRTARARIFLGLESVPHSAVDSTSRTAEQRDAQRYVEKALARVSSAKRDAFVLFELQGLSGEEVAVALNIPLKTVWTRLFHARREITTAIERALIQESRSTGVSREELLP